MSRPIHRRLPAALAALSLFGCAGEAQQSHGAPPPPDVTVEVLKAEAVAVSTVLPGRTAPTRVAEVRPQVSGIVTERLFEEGAAVEAGAPLYRIDPAPYRAALAGREADLSRAEALAAAADARAARLAGLVKTNAVSRQDHDDAVAAAKQARADIAAARAARDAARIEFERTTIAAPISGRIGRTLVTDGALATAGQAAPLAVITALDPIYVDIARPSADLLRWRTMAAKGEIATDNGAVEVALTLEDGSRYPLKGRLELTESTVDPATGTVTLRALFPNPDELLLPGMYVRAEIVEGVRQNALLAPQQALTRTPTGDAVAYVVTAEGVAEERNVETEQAIGDRWLVTEGLAPGERVIVEGFQRFRAGDAVNGVERPQVARAGAGPAGGGR